MNLSIFDIKSNVSSWKTINDGVMGGISSSSFTLNDAGIGIFSGKVSLENNGGFAMVQLHFSSKNVSEFTKVILKVKGDGKTYQFRIKRDSIDKHSYVAPFSTTSNWSIIEIPFNSMYPAFRGAILNLPNYSGEQMEHVAFLIGNKKEETFQLEIESIELK